MDYQTLQDEIKSAMKAHDNNRRDILRQVHTELKAIEVNERRDITEADVDAMLKRVIKQTKETLDGSIKAGNNQERTDTLTEQVAILEGYLPEQIEGEALMALIDEAVAETGNYQKGHGARDGHAHAAHGWQLRQSRCSCYFEPAPELIRHQAFSKAFSRCSRSRSIWASKALFQHSHAGKPGIDAALNTGLIPCFLCRV